jgi:hypothetical protein
MKWFMGKDKNVVVAALFFLGLVVGTLFISGYLLLTEYSTRSPNNLYQPNGFDGISCDDSIRKLNPDQLRRLINSNRINVRNLDELLGGDIDNVYTQLRAQIKIFLSQIECAQKQLEKLEYVK